MLFEAPAGKLQHLNASHRVKNRGEMSIFGQKIFIFADSGLEQVPSDSAWGALFPCLVSAETKHPLARR